MAKGNKPPQQTLVCATWEAVMCAPTLGIGGLGVEGGVWKVGEPATWRSPREPAGPGRVAVASAPSKGRQTKAKKEYQILV